MELEHIELDMLLVHARGASHGVGSPDDNKNNHPFVSNCKTVGLVHNGRIPDNEYRSLIKKYQVESSCDSELFLRIFEI
jgi:predicted glutamine amidotransferase